MYLPTWLFFFYFATLASTYQKEELSVYVPLQYLKSEISIRLLEDYLPNCADAFSYAKKAENAPPHHRE
jgi:hypothetical protein